MHRSGWRLGPGASAIAAVVALPGTALVVVPLLLVLLAEGTAAAAQPASPAQVPFWVGILCAAAGLVLMAWTILDFALIGRGTLAPWAPPTRLVVRGPYRHVRNPMISGVILVLLAESLLLQSLAIGGWLLLFAAVNAIYIPLREEKGLEARFGEDYRRYRGNVPRWMPRTRPWRGLDEV